MLSLPSPLTGRTCSAGDVSQPRTLLPVQKRLIRATTPGLVEPIDVGVTQPSLVTVPNVELLEVGQEWETSTGVFDFRYEDLLACIASQDDPALRAPVVKLGHVDPRFDGQPSLGRIINLRLENNDQTLVGDLAGMPLWLAQVLYTAYPRRSIEGQFDFKSRTGNTWDMVLTGVALLGDAYPAIDTLEDIQALWGPTPPPLYPVEDVEEIAASGSFFRARKVDDMPNWLTRKNGVAAATPGGSPVEASVSLDTVRRSYYDSDDVGMWWWIREVRINPLTLIVDDDEGGLWEVPVTVGGDDAITFGEPEQVKIEYVAASTGLPVLKAARGQVIAATHATPEEAGRTSRPASEEGATVASSGTTDTKGSDVEFTPEELARLGLPADATPDQIKAAVLEQAPATPSEDVNPESQPQTPATEPGAQPAQAPPVGVPAQTPPAAPDAVPATTQGLTVPDGMVLVDAATLEEMRSGIAASNALVKRTEKSDRDEVLDGAIRAGKFGKGRRAHYEGLLLSDPVGGKATISSLEPGLVPVAEKGEGGSVVEAGSAEDQNAYPTGWRKSVEAARSGVGTSVKVVQD